MACHNKSGVLALLRGWVEAKTRPSTKTKHVEEQRFHLFISSFDGLRQRTKVWFNFGQKFSFLIAFMLREKKQWNDIIPKESESELDFCRQQHKEVFILVCDGLTLWSFAKSIIVKSCSPTLVTMPSHTFLVMIMLVMMVMVIMTIIMMVMIIMVSNITFPTIFEVHCRISDISNLG